MSEVTRILHAIQAGDQEAADRLFPRVYDELRQLASSRMAGEPPGQTLQPTALVHEAWLRLGADDQEKWSSRAHFFGAAAEAMRRILVERARHRGRLKRGGQLEFVPLEKAALEVTAPPPDDEVLAVHHALERLMTEDSEAGTVVKLRYFAGLQLSEIAEVLHVSPRTASRLWAYARVRLREFIRAAPP